MADRGTPPLAMGRVGSVRIIGVTIASDLSVSAHVEVMLNAGARSIYAFRLLRAHRLPDQALKLVARATTINTPHMHYAGPAWWGYANTSDKERIQRIPDRMYKSRFLTEPDTDIYRLITAADDNLLKALGPNHRHVLRQFIPSE